MRPLYKSVRKGTQRAGRNTARFARRGTRQTVRAGKVQAQRTVTVGKRRVIRAGVRTGNKVAGGIGAVVVLIVGTGILIAVLRTPALVTKPAGFVTGVITSFSNLSKVGTK
jgi:hypothetical protein